MKKILIVFIIGILGSGGVSYYVRNLKDKKEASYNNYIVINDLTGKSIEDVNEYAKINGINIDVTYEYSFDILKDVVISQDVIGGITINKDRKVNVWVSKGKIPSEIYKKNKVNELGSVPIMMYHGIIDIKSGETKYIGGNVDKDGYNRTAEAFREDLEFYYKNGYRMIRLNDFVEGIVDVELGKSPIILTFDDGNENNFRVIGEKNGELIIDPNCAVGILEEFKKKYPDYGVTATFFVNSGLFNQDKYNEKILKWLVNNGYDIGNHTMSHCDFTKIDANEVNREVGGLYQILNNIIPDNYVNIVALPFGSPYNRGHDNYEVILNGQYNGESYETKAALRVGWEAEKSCFDKNFNATYLKRIRAYDNNGKDYDIKMNFDLLYNSRYISDGDKKTIVFPKVFESRLNDIYENLYIINF